MATLYGKMLSDPSRDLAEELKDAILSKDPQGVIVINENHKVVWVNDYFLAMFGYGWKSKITSGDKDVDDFVAERLRVNHSQWLDEWFKNPRVMKLQARTHNDIYGCRNEGSEAREEFGEEIHLEIEVAPYERSDGEILAIGFIREMK